MPGDRLEFGGRWTLEDSGRDYVLKSTHRNTHTHTLPRFGALVRR